MYLTIISELISMNNGLVTCETKLITVCAKIGTIIDFVL